VPSWDTLIYESPFFETVLTWLWSSIILESKDVKMVLIAYHILESSIGAYLEWLVNELMMTANKS
jgi:hypothetical protein